MTTDASAREEFKVGDVVQLKSGDEPFTVHDVNEYGIVVAWRDGKKVKFETFQREQFPSACWHHIG